MEQKRILAAARRRGRPVVTATQMLVSMVTEPQPTRAEVNDVANAVLDGTDAVMLSEETAVGVDPVHVVRTMAKIVLYTESCRTPELLGPEGLPPPLHDLAVAAEGAARMARQVGARAIVAWSQSGLAARLLSRAGPGLPIVAPTPRLETARQLALVRDVTPVFVTGDRAPEDRVRHGFGIVGAEEGWIVVFGHERGEAGRRLPWTRMARLEEPASWLGAVGARE
jgi:pyruvate kinase